MLINQKFMLCRYYGNEQNVFVDAEIDDGSLCITTEITRENNFKSNIITLYFDKENTKKLFSLIKIKDFKDEFCGVKGLKKLEQFCKTNKIISKVKKDF
ncbi:MAG: hypothetical protein ACOX1F_07785 [Erysipelotrichaceae bacterium]|jgi:hypothetical protein